MKYYLYVSKDTGRYTIKTVEEEGCLFSFENIDDFIKQCAKQHIMTFGEQIVDMAVVISDWYEDFGECPPESIFLPVIRTESGYMGDLQLVWEKSQGSDYPGGFVL